MLERQPGDEGSIFVTATTSPTEDASFVTGLAFQHDKQDYTVE